MGETAAVTQVDCSFIKKLLSEICFHITEECQILPLQKSLITSVSLTPPLNLVESGNIDRLNDILILFDFFD